MYQVEMNRQSFIHVMLLFALLFPSLAQAMPCCASMDAIQSDPAQPAMMHDMAQHADDGCFAGSPICCVAPSLAYEAVVLHAEKISPVHVPTVNTLLLSQNHIPPDRPPRF